MLAVLFRTIWSALCKVYILHFPSALFVCQLWGLLFPPLSAIPELHSQIGDEFRFLAVELLVCLILLFHILDVLQLLLALCQGRVTRKWTDTVQARRHLVITQIYQLRLEFWNFLPKHHWLLWFKLRKLPPFPLAGIIEVVYFGASHRVTEVDLFFLGRRFGLMRVQVSVRF